MNDKIKKIFIRETHIFCWFIIIGLLLLFIGVISKDSLVLAIILCLLISFYPAYIIGKFSAWAHYKAKARPEWYKYYDFKLSSKQLTVAWIEAIIIIIGSVILYLPRTQGEPFSVIEMKQWRHNILKIAIPVLLVGGILIHTLRDKTK